MPLGLLTFLLACRYLPSDYPKPGTDRLAFDHAGTLLLALTLAAYALAMTLGHGSFGLLNMALLAVAVLGGCLFVHIETKVSLPLINLVMFRDPVLGGSLAMNAMVETVMMATGLLALILLPAISGLSGYMIAIVLLTPGYQLFQAANNTTVMVDVHPSQRGVVSGMLNLSRNLGLVTGASLMGAVFLLSSAAIDITRAHPDSVATGMQITFVVALMLIVAALAIGSAISWKSSP